MKPEPQKGIRLNKEQAEEVALNQPVYLICNLISFVVKCFVAEV